MKISLEQSFFKKIFLILSWLIVLAGSVGRIIVWLQNRNLFIDEANVARNIYERNIAGLSKPLSYQQYAPPVFLWITKLNASLFGYSEQALRILPLLSGIGVLILLYLLLKEFISLKSIWYPLALAAVSYILICFSTELKQYMTDAFVVLLMIWLVLRVDLLLRKDRSFVLLWFIAGSVAIWLSMPSVFALAGAGLYYFSVCFRARQYQKLWPLCLVITLWIAQFTLYYLAILKPQADSAYLQNYHREFFMYLLPANREQLMYNWRLFRTILQETSGYADLSWKVNLALLLLGVIGLFRKNAPRAFLLVVPIITPLLASALHQYSLIERMTIFMMPLILALIGYGLDMLLSLHLQIWQGVVMLFGLRVVINHSMLLTMIKKPYQFETLTEELTFLKQHHISGTQVYMHKGAVPAFIYYTQIHPGKQEWTSFKEVHIFRDGDNLDSLAQNITLPAAFIYTSLSSEDLQYCKEAISRHLVLDTFIEAEQRRCFVYIYKK